MRLSVDPREGWETLPPGFRATVYCDGKELKRVVRVDTEAGLAFVHKTAEDGSLVVEGDEVATEEVRGVISVELK